MQTSKKMTDFLNSEEGNQTRQQLIRMMDDATYNTQPTYTSNSTLYPDNHIPFVDKHMNYLGLNPKVDPTVYLGNLRLISRIR